MLLVVDVLHLYGTEVGDENSRIEAQLDPACPPVRGDAQQVLQDIRNLLQNALDASESSHREGSEGRQCRCARSGLKAHAGCDSPCSTAGMGFPDHILKKGF